MNAIAQLNDQLRQGDSRLGKWVLTMRVSSLPADQKAALIQQVQKFDNFTPENDPHSEHDFGSVELDGERYFWKIDYPDAQMGAHSIDPSSPNATRRVLTLMHSSEY
ncbi:MAG: DUF3768 domain-containing protein [Leptolyngbyaceae cyanobacterium bins.349]|nr:DUF3768 domain-containing protein [Leptolyngbyaceae cyanobacterium bins.349]